jgi:hypothetical protein
MLDIETILMYIGGYGFLLVLVTFFTAFFVIMRIIIFGK